jgi:predicted NACHT family NTPase
LRALLVGAAGAGKTTLLLHEAQRMAADALASDRQPLPLYVSLAAFQEAIAMP